MVCYFHRGNDCAYTVALYLGGTIENFAKMMNEKAQKIGVVNTNFVTPHGLDSDNQYSCAIDVANLARYALRNKYINEAVNTTTIQMSFGSFTKTLNNTNALLRTYEPTDGGKTGFTNEANRCLIASASKGEFRIITVILGAETTEKRFGEAKELLQKTFERYKLMDITDYMHWYIKIPVHKGSMSYYEDQINDSMKIALTQEEYDSIYIKQDILNNITPPMEKGYNIGKISMLIDDEQIYTREVNLNDWISKSTIIDYMREGFLHMFDQRTNI